MFRPRVEESIYLQGCCQIIFHHPSVDVHQFAIAWEPDDAEQPTVPTCLILMRLKADPLVQDKLFQLGFGFQRLEFFRSDQFWSIDAQQPDADLWQKDSESQLELYVNGVTIRNLGDLNDMIVWARPLFQFYGQVRIQPSGYFEHVGDSIESGVRA